MILAHDFKRLLGLDRFMSVEVTLILDHGQSSKHGQ